MSGRPVRMTRAEEFGGRLEALAVFARSIGLHSEAGCLETLLWAFENGETRDAFDRLLDYFGPDARTEFRTDPAFPPPGWTGDKPDPDRTPFSRGSLA